MCSLFDNPHEQDARDCLLKYYNSEGIAHGSYVLSVAVGFFAFVQAIQYIPEISVSTIIPIFENSIKDLIIFSILSTFVTFGLYLFARTVYWGVLSGYALHVPPMSYEEAHRRDPAATNLIHRLNVACVEYFEAHHSDANLLVGAGARKFFMLRYVVIGVAIVIVLLTFF
jgi:hypothetical protein